MKYEVSTDGRDQYGLCAAFQMYAESFWTPDHMTPEQAERAILETFKRSVLGQLELLEVKATK